MKRLTFLLALSVATGASADDALDKTIANCAPRVAPSTMRALVAAESDSQPLAINVNGGSHLQRQPVSEPEAIVTARWLFDQGYSFDAGLAQINSKNFERLGVTPETVFQPCVNLAAAEALLTSDYAIAQKAGGAVHPVLTTLSRYNTGDNARGFDNGYVARVQDAAARQARPLPAATAGVAVMPVPASLKTGHAPTARASAAPAATDLFAHAPGAELFEHRPAQAPVSAISP